ncbi:hypothetical protein DL96DRAFT_238454 [Flagelloscypha sp. PMI_526]|nr:hypothetical protein DL96DRAFT_238454 [Flagelloscypha sp. PMI_526]
MLSLASTAISSWDSQISDIEAQIAALQVDARNTRRHRNALVPINQFPNEILVLVFLQRRDSVIDSNSWGNWKWTRGCLDVCSHWRSLCLATPQLWNHVVVDTRKGAEMAMSLTSLPFHIIARRRGSSILSPESLGNFLHRAASIEFDGWLYELEDFMVPIQGSDESPVYSAPYLERIDITVEDEQNAVHKIIAPLLRGAPNLRYISFGHNDRNTFDENTEDSNGYYHPLPSLASLFLTSFISASLVTTLQGQSAAMIPYQSFPIFEFSFWNGLRRIA